MYFKTLGSGKDDSSDFSSSTQVEADLPKPKSSIAYILAQIRKYIRNRDFLSLIQRSWIYEKSLMLFIATDFDSSQRIEFLEQKQEEIRRKYMHYKQEVAIIDRKRKKLRRKQREGMFLSATLNTIV